MMSIDDISMAVTFDEAGDMGVFKRAELRAVAAVALTRPLFGGGDVAEAGSAGRIMPQIPCGQARTGFANTYNVTGYWNVPAGISCSCSSGLRSRRW
jgi:hypothetical protein